MPSRTAQKTQRHDAFARWFAGSEVVNEDGSPRVVFHGTRSPVDFDVFSFGPIAGPDGGTVIGGGGDASAFLGPHFAESREVASAFACGDAAAWDSNRKVGDGDCGGRVIPVYLSIRNANVFEDDEAMIRGFDGIYMTGRSPLVEEVLRDSLGRAGVRDLDDPTTSSDRVEAVADALCDIDRWPAARGEEPPGITARRQLAASAVRAWKREGFDGVRYMNSIETEHLGLDEWDQTWVPFSPAQIKSAIGNDGRYRKGSPSIVSNPPAWSALGPGEPRSARELVGSMLDAGLRP